MDVNNWLNCKTDVLQLKPKITRKKSFTELYRSLLRLGSGSPYTYISLRVLTPSSGPKGGQDPMF